MPETPEQILRRLAFNALTKGLGTCGQYLLLSERDRIAKAVLAAVLPEYEKQIRAKVAKDIEAAHGPLDVIDLTDGEFDEGVQAAINTVRLGGAS